MNSDITDKDILDYFTSDGKEFELMPDDFDIPKDNRLINSFIRDVHEGDTYDDYVKAFNDEFAGCIFN